MPIIKGLEWTFDTVAQQYEKMRPEYVPALYEDLFRYKQIDETSCAMEVGIGGGQATLPVLKTGCTVTAVEYGENFSSLCRNKFREFPGFSVVTSKFEDVPCESNSYDLIYSASLQTIHTKTRAERKFIRQFKKYMMYICQILWKAASMMKRQQRSWRKWRKNTDLQISATRSIIGRGRFLPGSIRNCWGRILTIG